MCRTLSNYLFYQVTLRATENWANDNAYIKVDKLEPLLEQLLEQDQARAVNYELRMQFLRWPN
jgi:hypothetical protein